MFERHGAWVERVTQAEHFRKHVVIVTEKISARGAELIVNPSKMSLMHASHAEAIKSECDRLLDISQRLLAVAAEAKDAQDRERLFAQYKAAALSLMRLKALNRQIHTALETKRKEVETQKEKVDRLQLTLENMRYKQTYLLREIRVCKDLQTPQVDRIEADLERKVTSTTFSEHWAEQHEAALQTLQEEMESRKSVILTRDSVQATHKKHLDVLDKKRKFLDELPLKAETVKLAAQALKTAIPKISADDVNSSIAGNNGTSSSTSK